MSGSGGSGHGGGGSGGVGSGGVGSGGSGSGDACDINERAPINSPQPAIISGLSVGSRLSVSLSGSAPRQTVELHSPNGLAGSLTHRGALNIANCITAGNAYEAEIIQINGGQVTVQIERI
ncbi:hypothetical protein MTsPCn3_32430 [Erythrobacter sp. MTPC3]